MSEVLVSDLVTRQCTVASNDVDTVWEALSATVAEMERVPSAMFFFCSPEIDLDRFGPRLASLPFAVVGCTTSGQIGLGGFRPDGISAVFVAADEFDVETYLVALDTPQASAERVAEQARRRLESSPGGRAFGVVLADGLCLAEERMAAALHHSLVGLPLIGGSAGDNLAFAQTHVYFDGGFCTRAATLSVVKTNLPFSTFKFQHFVPSRVRVVVTAARTDERVVAEIDGLPALEGYARAVGIPVEEVTDEYLSAHPFLLRSGGDVFVRSVQAINPDRSLRLFCAIEEGLVLSIGDAVDPVETVRAALRRASDGLGGAEVILGFDCVLRRLQLEGLDCDQRVGGLLSAHRVVGFSTYGEIFNGMHINQTFTGVAIGHR
jgi:hypothetical protein